MCSFKVTKHIEKRFYNLKFTGKNEQVLLPEFLAVLFLLGILSVQEVRLYRGRQGDRDLLWFPLYQRVQEGLAHRVVLGVLGGHAHPSDQSHQRDPKQELDLSKACIVQYISQLILKIY